MLAALPPAASAKEYPLWEVGAGATVLGLPDYRGSDEHAGYVYPFPFVRYRGEWFRMDDRYSSPELKLLERGRVQFDVSVNASQPAPSDRNDARSGMPDLDATVEIGPVLRLTLWQNERTTRELTLQLPVRAAVALDFPHLQNIGSVANPVIDYYMRDVGPGGGWNVGMQAGPLFASRSYHQYFYSVDDPFATPSRPAYSATSGYSGTQATVTASKRFGAWWVGGFVRLWDLHGAAFEDSPLVKSRTSVQAGVAFAYIFAASGTRVESED